MLPGVFKTLKNRWRIPRSLGFGCTGNALVAFYCRAITDLKPFMESRNEMKSLKLLKPQPVAISTGSLTRCASGAHAPGYTFAVSSINAAAA